MVSVEEKIDALYLSHGEGLLSDEEFLLLFKEIMPNSDFKQSNFPYTEYEPFNWETYDALTCKVQLRFEKNYIPHLQNVLQIPKWIKFYRASYCTGFEDWHSLFAIAIWCHGLHIQFQTYVKSPILF